VRARVLDIIVALDMTPYYLSCCEQLKWQVDEDLVSRLRQANETRLAELERRLDDAVKNLGGNEIREAHLAKFEYYIRIGDKDKAISAYHATMAKTMALGHKVDLAFGMIRAAMFFQDLELVNEFIKKAHSLQEKDGDWERRNKLKVYEGLYWICMRDFSKAAKLLLECVATFSCTELLSYNTFIYYTVLSAMVGLDRVALREQVVNAPEVLTVIHEVPHLDDFLNSFYKCVYSKFFVALAHIASSIKLDRYWAPHASFFCREMRVAGYSQFLSSYRSVTLDSMARSFGVTADFLDKELSRFIAAHRLTCKIDKVSGIVETIRLDTKNAQYADVIKQGDLLLNRVQKLSRVISM